MPDESKPQLQDMKCLECGKPVEVIMIPNGSYSADEVWGAVKPYCMEHKPK